MLPRAECLRLVALAGKQRAVGRLAISTEGAPLVQPVNFAFEGGQVLVRIGEGFMGGAVPGRMVAFEVDGAGAGSGAGHDVAWSVLVRGHATAMPGTGVPVASFVPSPMPAVPRPGDRLVAIRPYVVTGRRFTMRPEDRLATDSGHVLAQP